MIAFNDWQFFKDFSYSRTFESAKIFNNPITCDWLTPFLVEIFLCLFWMHVDAAADFKHFNQYLGDSLFHLTRLLLLSFPWLVKKVKTVLLWCRLFILAANPLVNSLGYQSSFPCYFETNFQLLLLSQS